MRGNAQLLGGGEPVRREELYRLPHDLTPARLSSGSEHQSQISPVTQEAGPEAGGRGPSGARPPVCSKMRSILRSGWNGHSFESGQTDFSEMCPSSFVFTLKEPGARSVWIPSLQTIVWTEGVSNSKENQTEQLAENLQWVDAASQTHDPTRWDLTPLSSRRWADATSAPGAERRLHRQQPGRAASIRGRL